MAIHTMHTDAIIKHAYICICATFTKHAYICICATFTIHAYIYYIWIFMTIHRCMDTDHTTCIMDTIILRGNMDIWIQL